MCFRLCQCNKARVRHAKEYKDLSDLYNQESRQELNENVKQNKQVVELELQNETLKDHRWQ